MRASDLGCALAFLAAPLAVVAAFFLVRIYVLGMMDCATFDAGNRAGSILYIPPLALGLWLVFTVPAVIGALLRPGRLGVAIGLVLALIVGYGFLARVPFAAREEGKSSTYCTDGVPNSWPWFFAH